MDECSQLYFYLTLMFDKCFVIFVKSTYFAGTIVVKNANAAPVSSSSQEPVVSSSSQGMEISVFNSLGHKVRETRGLGCSQKVFTGAKGVYIVKVGNKTFKTRL